tara:strand:+ start:14155 stop:14592 length:438 start_codon:yes stop_codon:yes gene_type:complete
MFYEVLAIRAVLARKIVKSEFEFEIFATDTRTTCPCVVTRKALTICNFVHQTDKTDFGCQLARVGRAILAMTRRYSSSFILAKRMYEYTNTTEIAGLHSLLCFVRSSMTWFAKKIVDICGILEPSKITNAIIARNASIVYGCVGP